MLEFPEVMNISNELNNSIVGKKVSRVFPPSKAHKFCWYNGKPEEYELLIKEQEIISVEGFGVFVEINFKGGYKVRMSKNTVNAPCPKCGGKIIKETYLGGTVYYCSNCQALAK